MFSLAQKHWLLLVFLLLGLAVRSYRLPEMASYDFDQEYVTTFVLAVVRTYPIQLVGQGLSVQGLFMGPWYFYALVPFYMMAGLNPIGGVIGSVVLGLLTIGVYYKVAWKLFDSQAAGVVAAAFRAISFYAVSADWAMVPSYASDVVVVLMWLLLFQMGVEAKKKDRETASNWKSWQFWRLPALFILFGTLTSFHPIHFHFGIIFWLVFLIWRLRFPLQNWLVAVCALVAPVAPLLLFEYFRNWAMTRQLIGMFTGTHTTTATQGMSSDSQRILYTLNAALQQWREIWQFERTSLVLAGGSVLLVWAAALYYLKLQRAKEYSVHRVLLSVTLGTVLVYYSFFPSAVPEYYLRALGAVTTLYKSFAVVELYRQRVATRLVAVALVLGFMSFNAQAFWKKWYVSEPATLAYKQDVVAHIKAHATGTPFRLSITSQPGWQFGYASLFVLADLEPVADGPIYTIVAPASYLSDVKMDYTAGGIGVIYPKE